MTTKPTKYIYILFPGVTKQPSSRREKFKQQSSMVLQRSLAWEHRGFDRG